MLIRAVGPLTLAPLIRSDAAARLLDLIRTIPAAAPGPLTSSKVLPSLTRALRNLLLATADLVWGHIWGVGSETEVVSTGLVGLDEDQGARSDSHDLTGIDEGGSSPRDKALQGLWEGETALAASSTLGLVFEVSLGSTSMEFGLR